MPDVTRQQLWELVLSLGERTHDVERRQQAVARIQIVRDQVLDEYGTDSDAAAAAFDDETEGLRSSLSEAEDTLTHDLRFFVRIAKNLD